MTINKYIHTQN